VKPKHLTAEQIEELGPPCFETVARAEWNDRNEHVNIRYFVAVFDDAGDAFYPTVGLGEADHRCRESGTMDLEHHTHFVRELRPDDRLAVYLRIVGVGPKRFHYVMFLLNQSTHQLASIFECVNTFVDLTRRKSAPWPDDVRSALLSLLEEHKALSWPAPICGSMGA
jgi:acyl-CoA thioester hydrolase